MIWMQVGCFLLGAAAGALAMLWWILPELDRRRY